MKIERMERVVIFVKDVEKAEEFFSDLLGISFERTPPKDEIKPREKVYTKHADSFFQQSAQYNKVAISPVGLELIDTIPPVEKEGVRGFLLKVPNLEEAKAEMEEKGVRLLLSQRMGGIKEAIFHPDDLHGVRLVLVEYDAPTPLDAVRQTE